MITHNLFELNTTNSNAITATLRFMINDSNLNFPIFRSIYQHMIRFLRLFTCKYKINTRQKHYLLLTVCKQFVL